MVITLKIVNASTPEQEDKIHQLVNHIYTEIFPKYFDDEEIQNFVQLNFLNISGRNERIGTLKESYQIIASLETICILIKSGNLDKTSYRHMFERNAQILNRLGLSFPFSPELFLNVKEDSCFTDMLYAKPANPVYHLRLFQLND